jgi:spoIIIJ-associated protein
MKTQTFEASTVDKALEEAASTLEIAVADLDYTVEEKAADFWGLGDTVYQVTVTLPAPEVEEAPEAEPARAAAEPVAETVAEPTPAVKKKDDVPSFFAAPSDDEPAPAPVEAAPATPARPSEDAPARAAAPAPVVSGDNRKPEAPVATGETSEGEDLTVEAVRIIAGIFSAMGFECEAEAKLDGETMHIAITGEDNQYLLEGRGRGLAALELILNHSFRAFPSRAHKRVRVDAGDFRSQRDEEIQDMAYQVAHRAKETGSEQQTSELNPYERRIVHLTLADDPNVSTRSLGNGFLKAVNVIPSGGRPRRGR